MCFSVCLFILKSCSSVLKQVFNQTSTGNENLKMSFCGADKANVSLKGNVLSSVLWCPDVSGSAGSVPISAARNRRRSREEREDVHIGPARPSSPGGSVLPPVSSPEHGRTEETRCTSSVHLLNLSVSSSNRDANVAASVKTRPQSPNSCLDADVQRRLADDNRTSIKGPPEPNPPMPVRLRQRAAARCE